MSPASIDIDVREEKDVVVSNPLTIDSVTTWRAKTTVPTGTAPFTSSEMFKSPVRRSSWLSQLHYTTDLHSVSYLRSALHSPSDRMDKAKSPLHELTGGYHS